MKQAACPSCQTGNRFGARDPAAAKCGRCGARLFTGTPVDVDDAGLAAHLKLTVGAVLVDVWAPWCGPCHAMAPHFADAARRLEPDVRFLKINADQTGAPAQLGVRSIPTLILFHDGCEIDRRSGLMTSDQLAQWLRQALSAADCLETYS
jgi:thioredoxin 2